MSYKNFKITRSLIFCLMTAAINFPIQANETTINFSGDLFLPPCEINNGNPINFSWGSVDVSKIPTDVFLTAIPGETRTLEIPFSCAFPSKTLLAKWTGKSVPARDDWLQTDNYDKSGVFISLSYPSNTTFSLQSEHILSVNDVTGTPDSAILRMTVGLGSVKSAQEAAGKFSATASLTIRYQ